VGHASGAPGGLLVRPRPVGRPELRLFLLHHAGGSHAVFRPWVARFPPAWDVCLVEAPGRGRLAGTPAVTDVEVLVDRLLGPLVPLAEQPFALFGHSMGAIVGHQLTTTLRARGLPLPVWLGLSALPAPRFDGTPAEIGLYRLSSAQLRDRLGRFGGLPPDALADDAVWGLVEPLLRRDIELCASWCPGPAASPLPVPTSVFCGDGDDTAGPRQMVGWSGHVRRFLGARRYSGDHFYFQEQVPAVVRQIVTDVAAAAGE
jgi:surfactin synthase thioesterase subunit